MSDITQTRAVEEAGRPAQAPRRAAVPRAMSDKAVRRVFILPAFAVLLLMVAYPFLSLLYYSTLRFSILRPAQAAKYIGIQNYTDLLSDTAIWERFVFTGQFVVATVCVQFIIGIVSRPMPSSATSAAVTCSSRSLMLPMMLCPIVVGFLWRYMFNSEWGVMNYLLTLVGLAKIDWLGVPIKRAVGGGHRRRLDVDALRHPARHGGLPRHPGRHQRGRRPRRRLRRFFRFTRITLPMSTPILLIAFLLRLIDAFKQ